MTCFPQKAGFFFKGVEVRDFFQQACVCLEVVFGREELRKAAAIFEHTQDFFGFSVGGGQHKHKDDEILADVQRREQIGLFADKGSAAACDIQVLAIWMVAVSQILYGLVIYLGGGDDPEDKAGVGFTINGIYQGRWF